jgi:hypothetical protein
MDGHAALGVVSSPLDCMKGAARLAIVFRPDCFGGYFAKRGVRAAARRCAVERGGG